MGHGIYPGAWVEPGLAMEHGIGHGESSLGSVLVHGDRNLGSALEPCSEWAMKQKTYEAF